MICHEDMDNATYENSRWKWGGRHNKGAVLGHDNVFGGQISARRASWWAVQN